VARSEASTLQFFYDLGIPVANGYWPAEAGTVITSMICRHFGRYGGKPLPGPKRSINPAPDGVGEVALAGHDRRPDLTIPALENHC
jgi:hypothetical protein